MNQRPRIEHFSDSYYILPDLDVETANVGGVVVARDVLSDLGRVVGSPLLKLGDEHHWLGHEYAIAPGFVAVPEESGSDNEDPVLMAKPRAARQMVNGGVVEPPEGRV